MMKVWVGFRYLAEGQTPPLVVFKTKEQAILWEKSRWNNGYVELEIE